MKYRLSPRDFSRAHRTPRLESQSFSITSTSQHFLVLGPLEEADQSDPAPPDVRLTSPGSLMEQAASSYHRCIFGLLGGLIGGSPLVHNFETHFFFK